MTGLLAYYRNITPTHLDTSREDFIGNGSIGRYVLLTGSKKRAQTIADHFENLQVKDNPRGHTIYLGTLHDQSRSIDVAAVATGMGSPSMDIILHELLMVGARRFLRIGTAGSLQPNLVQVGNLIQVTGAVRDESTSNVYVHKEYPAIASWELFPAIQQAIKNLKLEEITHAGIVHSKDSLYGREGGLSPVKSNSDYMNNLKNMGVLASEMECSALFVLSSLANYIASDYFKNPKQNVLAGAILAIIGGENQLIGHGDLEMKAMNDSILLGLETIKVFSKWDQ